MKKDMLGIEDEDYSGPKSMAEAQRILNDELRKSRQIVTYSRGKLSSYNSGYCEALVRYRALGKSLKSFAAQIGVKVSTVKKWAEDNQEFKNALELSEEAAQAYWEEVAHGQATGEIKGGSTTAMAFIMKNQFSDDYKDKQEVEHSGDLTFLIDTGIGGPGPEEKAPPIEVEGTVLDDGDLL